MDRRLILLGLALGLAACAQPPAPTGVPTPILLPLPAATASLPILQATAPGPQATPVIIASPTATSTPVTHVVAAGETMLGIAIDFGVSLEALQAANPTVEARFLSIGTVLVIPPPEGGLAAAATHLAPLPPAPVDLSQPICYPTGSAGLYCLVEAHNPNNRPLNGVSVRFILAGADGLPFASQTAFGALDLIPPGGVVPLAALFAPMPTQRVAATGLELQSAILVSEPLSTTQAVVLDVSAAPGAVLDGRWTVAGRVRNPSTQPLPSAWVLLSVYDASGRLTGFRKQALANGIGAGETRQFTISSDSFSGPVDHGLILAEGQN
jgi:LysM repeat protein